MKAQAPPLASRPRGPSSEATSDQGRPQGQELDRQEGGSEQSGTEGGGGGEEEAEEEERSRRRERSGRQDRPGHFVGQRGGGGSAFVEVSAAVLAPRCDGQVFAAVAGVAAAAGDGGAVPHAGASVAVTVTTPRGVDQDSAHPIVVVVVTSVPGSRW